MSGICNEKQIFMKNTRMILRKGQVSNKVDVTAAGRIGYAESGIFYFA